MSFQFPPALSRMMEQAALPPLEALTLTPEQAAILALCERVTQLEALVARMTQEHGHD